VNWVNGSGAGQQNRIQSQSNAGDLQVHCCEADALRAQRLEPVCGFDSPWQQVPSGKEIEAPLQAPIGIDLAVNVL
jgi:hypothetical protein